MDEMDWALLRELQADARLSFSELSRRVHLSPPAVAERVRRLEESGVITGYHAHVDLTRAGRTVVALIRMSCYGARCILHDPDVATWPEILEIHRITGDACSVLKVAAGSIGEFEGVIDRLAPYGQPSSTMVLSSPLNWQPLTRCKEGPPVNASGRGRAPA
ncbi:Lrp/AsnC family transcriptional regulator [Micromonospora gifhornensis]|uniref:AsnC family transcriptional regulator n=1 Tax=Micromonospora gifhornensis TaxID=84594 RepID=A0ABQ4IIA4_9ACTN|nr:MULTISPECIES: Lrp/AsnC family transcriptional regulator [Micromonospora]PMR58011.1 AsnC family transcriptional regulator [Verrucosispora sp. ts21]RUL89927.1 Lrp/AsnC family transcriptional regulator [Verrucosispora sp. FIM060022]GIJ17641.1 AsnC family transcriptional regulator [Micromonospora gifhornensis]